MGRKSQSSRRKSQRSRKLPRTMKLPSRKSAHGIRRKFSQANMDMNLTELQNMAKSRGIQFGGLNKTQLIRKINRYQ